MTDQPAGAPDRASEPPPAAPGTPPALPASPAGARRAGLDPRGWRTTIAVAAIMIGAVGGANLVNAAFPFPSEPSVVDPGPPVPGPSAAPDGPSPAAPGPVAPGTPVEVGSGVVLYPPAGWTVVGSDVGQVALQRASAILIAVAGPFDGTPGDLATAYRDAFFAEGQLTAGDPETVQLGDAIPAVAFPFTGISGGAQVDGVIAAGVGSGTGVVLNFVAPRGQLQGISDDIDIILATVQLATGRRP